MPIQWVWAHTKGYACVCPDPLHSLHMGIWDETNKHGRWLCDSCVHSYDWFGLVFVVQGEDPVHGATAVNQRIPPGATEEGPDGS